MVRDFPRDHSGPAQWQLQHPPVDQAVDYTRYQQGAPMTATPPLSIEKTLREYSKIPIRSYILPAILDNGDCVLFSSPNTSKEDLAQLCTRMKAFVRDAERQGLSGSRLKAEEPGFGIEEYRRHHGTDSEASGRRLHERSRIAASETPDVEWPRSRKRARPNLSRRALNVGEDDAPGKVITRQSIQVGDEQAIWDIYCQRFRNLQQGACKIVAKAFVKVIEPKKQSTHPYTGAEEKAPGWWPRPWGPTRDDRVRHKEPDHLYKRERVHLIAHIIRLVVEPNHKQHAEIQKLNLNVSKLEEAAYDALAPFFADTENPNNAKKKPYLKEIFYVAKHEEKYRNGEIDANAAVYIMADDKLAESYQSDAEEVSSTNKEEVEEPRVPSASSSTSPQRSVSHGMLPSSSNDHGSGGNLGGPPFLGELTHRSNTYPAPSMMHSDLSPDHHAFVEGGGGLGVVGQTPMHGPHAMPLQNMGPTPHGSGRRSSLFNSPTDFGNPSDPTIYSNWHQGSTAPNNSPMYAFTQQQGQGQGPFIPQSAVSMAQSQPYLGSTFEGLPRGFNPNQGHMFRPSNVPSESLQPQSYMHLPHHGRAPKVEGVGRGPIH